MLECNSQRRLLSSVSSHLQVKISTLTRLFWRRITLMKWFLNHVHIAYVFTPWSDLFAPSMSHLNSFFHHEVTNVSLNANIYPHETVGASRQSSVSSFFQKTCVLTVLCLVVIGVESLSLCCWHKQPLTHVTVTWNRSH